MAIRNFRKQKLSPRTRTKALASVFENLDTAENHNRNATPQRGSPKANFQHKLPSASSCSDVNALKTALPAPDSKAPRPSLVAAKTDCSSRNLSNCLVPAGEPGQSSPKRKKSKREIKAEECSHKRQKLLTSVFEELECARHATANQGFGSSGPITPMSGKQLRSVRVGFQSPLHWHESPPKPPSPPPLLSFETNPNDKAEPVSNNHTLRTFRQRPSLIDTQSLCQPVAVMNPNEDDHSPITPSSSSPLLFNGDFLFQTSMERSSIRERALIEDKMLHLTQTIERSVGAADRARALRGLVGLLLTKTTFVNVYFRKENRLQQLLQLACDFDPIEQPALAQSCVWLLFLLCRDPPNLHFVHENVWMALCRTLLPSETEFSSQTLSQKSAGSPDPPSTLKGLRRYEFRLGPSTVTTAAAAPALAVRKDPGVDKGIDSEGMDEDTIWTKIVSSNDSTERNIKSLAVGSLINILLAQNRLIADRAATPQVSSATTSDLDQPTPTTFTSWFLTHSGSDVIETILKSAIADHRQLSSDCETAPSLLIKTLHFLELLTCTSASKSCSTFSDDRSDSSGSETEISDVRTETMMKRVYSSELLNALVQTLRVFRFCEKAVPLILKVLINLCASPHHRRAFVSEAFQLDAFLQIIFDLLVYHLNGRVVGVEGQGIPAKKSGGAEEGDFDTINLCLCLFINLTEHNCILRQKVSQLQTLPVSGKPCTNVKPTNRKGLARRPNGEVVQNGQCMMLPFLVHHFEERCSHGKQFDNVVAAYIGLLLGCLTIGHESNRAVVRGELRKYDLATSDKPPSGELTLSQDGDPSDSQISDHSDPNENNPMARIVFVLQEFLRFQSEAKVLVASTVVGLHHVISELVKDNGIVIATNNNSNNDPASQQLLPSQESSQFTNSECYDSD